MQEILERLVAANIELLPITQIERHFVFSRDGFIALVERRADGSLGKMGSPGLFTEKGMAVLLERGGVQMFVAKGFEQAATEDDITRMRSFAADLQHALKG